MKNTLLSEFVADIWSDLHDASLLWQLAALALCFAIGWGVSRLLHGRLKGRGDGRRAVRLGLEGFARILWPLVTLALIAGVTPLFAQWRHANLLRLAIPLVGSFAVIRLVFHVLRRVFARGGEAGALLLLAERIFAALVWVGVALYVTGLWPELARYLDHNTLPIGRHQVSLLVILQAGASVAVTLMLALWAGTLLEERLMRMDSLHSSLRVVMARAGRALLILVAVLLSLSLVGIDLTVLSVFGGALGVGLGLGLQKLASSYVSGFVILLERSLAIGDIVTIDKYSGQVTRINTRYTIVRSPDGTETVIPNDLLVSSPVQNYSLTDRTLRLATRITVSYETDIEAVITVLERAAASVARVAASPAPSVLLVKFEPDGIELETGFWIDDPENGRGNVLSEVNRAIWKAFKAHGIQVPYPQREIRLVDGRANLQNEAVPLSERTSSD
ncbi:Mechanosensitive ion channel [Noviherbaspirillum humi]|uniref:Mechanosensitive ion channel n=1 Tax=Noviherbaspirillum humi TaxID=1688639 RepID=A0A239DWM4_9BURK|nr:mechanosensitive ion channel domain-containing protein [Noviherbaspirillum humi]SNS36896.1 Mechanosensitive ion channel [Noviherbaspirillum humi]